MNRNILLGLLLFILLHGFYPTSAGADGTDKCTCTPNTPEKRWQEADAVFIGTVESITVSKEFRSVAFVDPPVEVTLLVDEGFKGATSGGKFVLKTSLTRETCTGHPFEPWKKYIVFAYRRTAEELEPWSLYNYPSGTYDVGGLCGGTKPITDKRTAWDTDLIHRELEAAKKKKKTFKFF